MDIDVEVGGVSRRPWYRQPWVIAGSALLVVALVAGGSLAAAAAASRDDVDPGDGASVEAATSEPASASASASQDATLATASPSALASASASAAAEGVGEPVVGGAVTLGASQPWQQDCSSTAGVLNSYEYVYFRLNADNSRRTSAVHPGDDYRTLLAPGHIPPSSGPGAIVRTGASLVAWSPNSRYVAWVDYGLATLNILDVRTGESRAFSNASTRDYSMLAWSGDSSRLAYVGWAGTDESVVSVTASTGASTTMLSDAHINGFAWSPNGASLAISHTAYKPGAIPQTKDSVLDVVTGAQVVHIGILGLSPAWSPDGGALFFLGDDDADGQWATLRYSLTTSAVTSVTPEAAFDGFLQGHWQRFAPAFSLDGGTVAMVAPAGGRKYDVAVYVAHADGTAATEVSRVDALEAPLWNRQGTRFMFRGDDSFVVYDATTGSSTDFGYVYDAPVWMPDGLTPLAWGHFCEDRVIRAQVVTSATARAPMNFGGDWVEKTLPYISPDGTLAVGELRGDGVTGFGLYLFEMP